MKEKFWSLEIVHHPNRKVLAQFMEWVSVDKSLNDYFRLVIERDESNIPIYLFIVSDYINRVSKNEEIATSKLHTLYFMLNGVFSLFYDVPLSSINTKLYCGYLPEESKIHKSNYEIEIKKDIKYLLPFEFTKKIETNHSNNLVLSTINLAMNHKSLFQILIQFGFEDSWSRLYSIWDSVVFSVKSSNSACKCKDDVIKFLELDPVTIDTFQHCANSYGLLFLEARHGDMGWEIPKKTMSKEDAIKLIKTIILNYANKIFEGKL